VLAHRGISSVLMHFKGQAGHASGVDALQANALHHAMHWGSRALDFVESQAHHRLAGLTGLRFNIGRVEGGIKANVIAPSAEVRFGFRPLPSMAVEQLHETFGTLAAPGSLERYAETFRGPSLPSGDIAMAEAQRLAARDLADELGLPIGNAVDFWTKPRCSPARPDRLRLRPRRHRPGAHRRRVGRAGTVAALHRYPSCASSPVRPPRRFPHEPRARYAYPRPPDPPDHRAPALEHGRREGDLAVPQALSQLDAARFAVVKVGGAVLRDDLDALTSSLAFLQDVGLTPIVLHGAGPQLDAELAAAGIDKRTINGLRVTSPEALAIVRRVFHAQNLKL
jgi:hypothetical protein